MKLKQFIILFSLFFLLAGIVFSYLLGKIRTKPQNQVQINEINQMIIKQWPILADEWENPDFSAYEGDLNFTVLTISGVVLYKTNPQCADTIQAAIANQYTILDVIYLDEIAGKILIDTELDNWLSENQKILFIFFVVFLIVEMLLIVFFLFKIRSSILMPFKKLENFAVHIAGGNLDFPLNMDKSNIFGAFSESFDLMRDELKNSREKERLAEQSKKELVAKLSHDIKTPIASILAVSELMQVSAESEKDREKMQIVREKAKWIDTLISDLFRATLEELQNVSVSPIEKDSQILVSIFSAADYLKCTDIEPVPACILLLDEIRTRQILDNIIVNSYKYANTKIKISFTFEAEFLAVKIKDFGSGVADAELPFLFEKYYRGKNALEKEGVGLGLHISRYLMQQMGGDISCENETDGFSVKIYLKLA